jgi:peptide/nickel transport system substrate-binding protein
MMKRLSLLLKLVILAAWLAACGTSTPPTTAPAPQATTASTAPTAAPQATTAAAAPTTAPATPQAAATSAPSGGTPKVGGTLTIGTDALKQFDPAFVADDASFHAISNIFSLLYRIQGTDMMPDLATSWEYTNDTTLVFHLRHGAMFQDDNAVFAKGASREVVADDVVYSLNRSLQAKGGCTVCADLIAAFKSIEAVDKYTVRLNLTHPDAIIFGRARGISSIAIVPKEAIDKLGDKFATNPVGSGPFKFVSYKPDDSLTLVRNDLYWLKPNLDKVVYKIIPDASVAIIALEKGEIDIYNGNVPSADVERIKANKDIVLYPGGCPVMTQLMFNMKDPLFANQKFRQAIAYALDGDAMNQNIYQSAAITGAGTAGPGVPGYDPTLRDRYFKYDPQAAKALLTQLGYTDSGGLMTKDGQPLKVPLEIWSTTPMPRFGDAIVSQLKAVGITVDLQTSEFGTWINDWNAGADKMMIMQGWCGEGGTNGLWSKASYSKPMGYDDAQVFDLLDQANQIIDPVKRDQTLKAAADRVYSQYWAVPFGFYNFYNSSRSWVHDFSGTLWFENLATDRNNVWLSK